MGFYTLQEIRLMSVETMKALYLGSSITPLIKYARLIDEQTDFAHHRLKEAINPQETRDFVYDGGIMRRNTDGTYRSRIGVLYLKAAEILLGRS